MNSQKSSAITMKRARFIVDQTTDPDENYCRARRPTIAERGTQVAGLHGLTYGDLLDMGFDLIILNDLERNRV